MRSEQLCFFAEKYFPSITIKMHFWGINQLLTKLYKAFFFCLELNELNVYF